MFFHLCLVTTVSGGSAGVVVGGSVPGDSPQSIGSSSSDSTDGSLEPCEAPQSIPTPDMRNRPHWFEVIIKALSPDRQMLCVFSRNFC
jgi:hypothetical protein